MQVVNFTEARNNLKKIFDYVYQNNEETIIHRKNGENVVIISLDEYNALKETNYLLSTKNNRDRLLSSLQHAREGRLEAKELLD